MMIESLTFSISEYTAELTQNSHQTVLWLARNGYLDEADAEDLLSRLIVTHVKNQPTFGQRLLDRFFGRDSNENAHVFPIVLLDSIFCTDSNMAQKKKRSKPKLEVVKNDDGKNLDS